MKNILIVTVGTRDIQVATQKELNFREPNFSLYENKNVPGYKLFSNPLDAGLKISKDKYFLNLIEYPIVKPAIDYLINDGKYISDLILICTDQQLVEERFNKNDTIHFAKIIEQLILKHYSRVQIESIHNLSITNDVTNYGKMYDLFNEKLPQILKNIDNCNLYVYPQGGIDAINFQVLLKSIELFPNTYHLYKSEASNYIEISDFPYKFRTGIERQNILSLIENFYYHEVFSSDPFVKLLIAYAEERLLFNYQRAYELLNNSSFKTPLTELLKSRSQDLYNQSLDNEMAYLKDFYLSVKIAFRKQDYSSFILKIYALCESFMKDEVCKYLKLINRNNQKTDYEILRLIEKDENLFKFIKVRVKELENSKYESGIALKPFTYIAINEYFDSPSRFSDIFIKKTLLLRDLRVNIAHYARNFDVDDIQNVFFKTEPVGFVKDAISLYFEQGDEFWGVSGFGDYEIINEAIKTRLLTNKTT